MRSSLNKYNYFLVLILVFIVSELIVNPIGDFPLNDDWSYGKALFYTNTEGYTIGHFCAMSLFTHLMWGVVFTKIFGFSFTVLRISTMVSALIGLFLLNKLVVKITGNKLLGLVAGLLLLFNPVYFNLSNTYMTDVNFSTLLIVCCYCAFLFYESGKMIHLILFFLFSAGLVLIRQFGIIVPVCFMVSCFAVSKKKLPNLLFSFVGTTGVYLVLKLYESYLSKILPPDSGYKSSGSIDYLSIEFWKLFCWYFELRYKTVLLYALVFVSPLAMVYIIPLAKRFKWYYVLGVFIFCSMFVCWLFNGVQFPWNNVLNNMSVGPETFYESLISKTSHNFSKSFASLLTGVKYVFSSLTLVTIVLYFFSLFRQDESKIGLRPQVLFLVALFLSYCFMLFIAESFFDRYLLPIIIIMIILFSFMKNRAEANYWLTGGVLICFFYVSVFGTRDYFTLNRTKWEAYEYIKRAKNSSAEKINGGFEINCWNDGKNTWWSGFHELRYFDYLIQFRPEEGFKAVKSYEFQRYFPYKKDTITIFEKEIKVTNY
jgi:hypothetical protein